MKKEEIIRSNFSSICSDDSNDEIATETNIIRKEALNFTQLLELFLLKKINIS